MTPSPEGLPPGQPSRIGHYRIEERLGAGGMGAVYRAFDETLHRPVAIKRVEGKTLDRVLGDGLLELPQAVGLAREVAEGLSEAHAHGIVHRDLKAANVMITGAGRVKVLDFGLAKTYSGDSEQDISTPGAVLGTYHAMSPEQAQGLAVDHRSDLFSLGSLLYEMVSGISPFHASAPSETLARICAHEPPPVSETAVAVPLELSDLIMRLLSKSPEQRPQSSWEVARALDRIARSGGK